MAVRAVRVAPGTAAAPVGPVVGGAPVHPGVVVPGADPVELADAIEAHEEDWEEEEEEPDPGTATTARELSRSCHISLVAGIIAILLAGLGLVPPVIWTSLPALVAGLVAVYAGLVGLGETGSRSGRWRGRGEAVVGIGLGSLGMFLPRVLQLLL